MSNISEIKNCTNCGACVNICTTSAIAVNQGSTFYSIDINPEKCIGCGACLKICPINSGCKTNAPIAAYGGWSKDEKLVDRSSSGGIFGELAKETIKSGGKVYGAVYSEDFKSVIFASSDERNICDLQKSKYVESITGSSFKKIKRDLSEGKRVLFCGSPCQTAGLKNYIHEENDLLVTCDFACGGFPSHKMYEDYISRLEKKFNANVVDVDFRPKTYGWIRHSISVKFSNGKEYDKFATEDDFFRNFIYGKYTVRENCHDCKFSAEHCADITLADFWKSGEMDAETNSRGTSLVLCNTEKGLHAIENITYSTNLYVLDTGEASYNNRATHKSDSSEKRNLFISTFEKEGFSCASKKVTPLPFNIKIKNILKRKKYKVK